MVFSMGKPRSQLDSFFLFSNLFEAEATLWFLPSWITLLTFSVKKCKNMTYLLETLKTPTSIYSSKLSILLPKLQLYVQIRDLKFSN